MHALPHLSPLDWLALVTFFACWGGYAWFSEHSRGGAHGLNSTTQHYRLLWAYRLLERDIRVADSTLIGNLVTSVSFYANTTIYIIAGLIAALGAADQLLGLAADLPFSALGNKELLEIKLMLVLGSFVFAYFKFTWSLRQFNLLTIALGAVPLVGTDAEMEKHARKFAAVNSCAGNDFNRGLRAYYFGMAVMAWMVSAWLFILSTFLIVFVMARREFASPVFKALSEFAED